MIKNCKSCDYGSINELNDIVCTNSDSANCCEFMRDDDTCQHWQNYQENYCPVEIDNVAAIPTLRCFNCKSWCIIDGICGLTNKKTDHSEVCRKWELCDDDL